MKCENCKHWEYFDDALCEESPYDDDKLGTCQRYPPVFIGHQFGFRRYSSLKWEQPTTHSNLICGEFSAKDVA